MDQELRHIEVTWDASTANPFYKLETQDVVDGVNWFTIFVTSNVTEWLQTQDSTLWYTHRMAKYGSKFIVKNMIDVREDLYLIIKLKFNG